MTKDEKKPNEIEMALLLLPLPPRRLVQTPGSRAPASVTSPSPSSALTRSPDSCGKPDKHKARPADRPPARIQGTAPVLCDEGGFKEGERARRSERQKKNGR